MNRTSPRLAELTALTAQAERERELLAQALFGVAEEVRSRRATLRVASTAATVVAAGATAAWRIFGKTSPAAQIGRAASGASILLGVGKAFLRLKKFL